jgi:hypothetical protein
MSRGSPESSRRLSTDNTLRKENTQHSGPSLGLKGGNREAKRREKVGESGKAEGLGHLQVIEI